MPQLDPQTLAHEIVRFLNTEAGKAARGKDFANILAAYLAQKCSITDRKSGELRSLIERNPDDLAAFLDEISFKRALALIKRPAAPASFKDLINALLNI